MFKKLKDKLAEEVKSSPQRIQQFAQAAQAAVTSASSSISDITNNDLFSIGDSDSQQNRPIKQAADTHQRDAFQGGSSTSVPLQTSSDLVDLQSASYYPSDFQKQRRLSNSSFASDVSFKLPTYESPSMYHLQSDMDVSASEAEERGLASPGAGASLERVTKEQLYAAYRRTHQRYGKYRSQYADLARHYKLLERENAKARSVLVETQDKALRRISELREQCSLEQSAKAHLERALRMDIDEKNLKIETLTTKIKLLQTKPTEENCLKENVENPKEIESPLIDISMSDSDQKPNIEEAEPLEVTTLKNKIEKMELLVNKYKELLKTLKEKNVQLTTELQVMTSEMQSKNKENEQLKTNMTELSEAFSTIQELKNTNEDLQNKLNTYDFTKTKELTILESDLQKEREEMSQLKEKIDVYSKKEEEYAISLAENKLRIHKELESKEAEIKSLKDSLSISKKEIQSMSIIADDYKQKLSALEDECSKLNNKVKELNQFSTTLSEKDAEIQQIKQKCFGLEQLKSKSDEEYKCLQLQFNQETAEKLAMVDRNTYLEDRNKQLQEENSKKTSQLKKFEKDLQKLNDENSHKAQEVSDVNIWKEKYETLESEIQEERVELVKLQAEIEKLLKNDDALQSENCKLQKEVSEFKASNDKLAKDLEHFNYVNKSLTSTKEKLSQLRIMLTDLAKLAKSYKENNKQTKLTCNQHLKELLKDLCHRDEIKCMEVTIQEMENNHRKLEDISESLKAERDSGFDEIRKLKQENEVLANQHGINSKLEVQINDLNNEKDNLIVQLRNIKLEHSESEAKIQDYMNRYDNLNKDYSKINEDNSNLKEKYAEIEKVCLTNQEELKNILEKSQNSSEKVNLLEKENEDLILQLQKSEKLSQDMKVLVKENKELKSKFEGIVNNVIKLEKELSEVKSSHLEIDQEKDHLTSILKELEQNMKRKAETQMAESQTVEDFETLQLNIESAQKENDVLKSRCEQIKQEKEILHEKVILLDQTSIELQTELSNKNKIIDDLNKTSEIHLAEKEDQCEVLRNEVVTLKNENLQLNEKLSEQKVVSAYEQPNNKISNNAIEKYESLKSEYDKVKEDNRHLKSDVEGLQSYLTKLSKENSTLNDKLREVISTSEHIDSNESQINSLLENIQKLNLDVQTEKDKADELSRQNALIAEENLELKDQLRSHTYENSVLSTQSKNNHELDSKYEQLLKSKTELENHVSDLDQQNKNTQNSMLHLQESNQKLRLSNEKLERRLDEALVSLRHLHSLQEHTELEYLKNILFEYLTGSGSHSVTLAKVLAAVVKFDDKQTNAVLQKEKERQGLLRQLGLL